MEGGDACSYDVAQVDLTTPLMLSTAQDRTAAGADLGRCSRGAVFVFLFLLPAAFLRLQEPRQASSSSLSTESDVQAGLDAAGVQAGLARKATGASPSIARSAILLRGESPIGEASAHIPALGQLAGVAYPSCQLFLGIQYGLVPERWTQAQPAKPWRPATLSAKNYGPVCPAQSYDFTLEQKMKMQPPNSMLRWRADRDWYADEQCLYLNVYTPGPSSGVEYRMLTNPSAPLLPVLIWLHGGSFVAGAGSDVTSEDAAVLTARGVIVATVNYRLGVFGFLASKHLKDAATGAVGNFGLLDQRLGLSFLRSHIAAFGGDPERITVFGWSSGAFSVAAHLVMPASFGLFQRAIMQSGGFASWTIPFNEANFNQTAQCLCGLEDKALCVSQMRNATTDAVLACSKWIFFTPTKGGPELPLDPAEAVSKGKADFSVSIIIGTALYDSLIDLGLDANRAGARAWMASCFGANATSAGNETAIAEAWRLYDPGQSSWPMEGWSASYWAARAFQADHGLTCPARRAARRWAQEGKAPAFWYQWAYDAPFNVPALASLANQDRARYGHPGAAGTPPGAVPPHGVCWPCPGPGHGSDLPFLFQDHYAAAALGRAAKDKRFRVVGLGDTLPVDGLVGSALSDAIQRLWVRFASAKAECTSATVREASTVAVNCSGSNAEALIHAMGMPPADDADKKLPKWHPVRSDGGVGPALLFEGPGIISPLVTDFKEEKCDFWDRVPEVTGC